MQGKAEGSLVYRFDNWALFFFGLGSLDFSFSHWIRDLISPFYHDRSRQKGKHGDCRDKTFIIGAKE